MTLRFAAAFALLVAVTAASAGTGYKCVSPDGSVSFQDRPCPREASSSQFEYRDEHSGDTRDTAPPPAEPKPAPAQNEPAPTNPRVSSPEFYACTRADGERYYSDTGVTAAYAMPLGVLGYPPSSLDSTAHLGVSAPELSRPPIVQPGTSSDIAASYVMVKDVCRRLSPEAACAALRSERDKIGRQAQRAFKEERAPLEARLRVLDAKLAEC